MEVRPISNRKSKLNQNEKLNKKESEIELINLFFHHDQNEKNEQNESPFIDCIYRKVLYFQNDQTEQNESKALMIRMQFSILKVFC